MAWLQIPSVPIFPNARTYTPRGGVGSSTCTIENSHTYLHSPRFNEQPHHPRGYTTCRTRPPDDFVSGLSLAPSLLVGPKNTINITPQMQTSVRLKGMVLGTVVTRQRRGNGVVTSAALRRKSNLNTMHLCPTVACDLRCCHTVLYTSMRSTVVPRARAAAGKIAMFGYSKLAALVAAATPQMVVHHLQRAHAHLYQLYPPSRQLYAPDMDVTWWVLILRSILTRKRVDGCSP